MLKNTLASLLALSFLVSSAAFAETAAVPSSAPHKMEKKMEHKKMTEKAGPRKLTAQQEKMRTCNARAKGMKGEARKNFMRECLRKK
ncbi:MAG: hypothetical protein JJ693_01515 [Acidithiobacillus sp.]|nr:hypothetical protein [Acidithiobacillus sp.]